MSLENMQKEIQREFEEKYPLTETALKKLHNISKNNITSIEQFRNQKKQEDISDEIKGFLGTKTNPEIQSKQKLQFK